MTRNAQKPSRPGMRQGRTSEFTLFFHVKPGHGKLIRNVFTQPGFEQERAKNAARIGTLHDARWVLFDDDTRLMFATNFDGDWDAYIDDFAANIPDVFDEILQHAEGYPGIKDPNIKDFIVKHQATACSYYRAISGATLKDEQKALRVQEAFQHLLDEAS